MALLLCCNCMVLLRAKRGHRCRTSYPKSTSDSLGVARIGVLNMLCIDKLWPRECPWTLRRETII